MTVRIPAAIEHCGQMPETVRYLMQRENTVQNLENEKTCCEEKLRQNQKYFFPAHKTPHIFNEIKADLLASFYYEG